MLEVELPPHPAHDGSCVALAERRRVGGVDLFLTSPIPGRKPAATPATTRKTG
jgi:hypothetical protein